MGSMDATELSAYSVQHNPWHAAIYNANTAQTVAVGSAVRLTFDTVEYDPSGMASLGAGNSYMIIQQPGVYLINGAVTMASIADTIGLLVSVYKNGAELARGAEYTIGSASPNISQLSASCTVTLAIGDVIALYAQNFTTNRAVYIGANNAVFTYLQVCYIGPA